MASSHCSSYKHERPDKQRRTKYCKNIKNENPVCNAKSKDTQRVVLQEEQAINGARENGVSDGYKDYTQVDGNEHAKSGDEIP